MENIHFCLQEIADKIPSPNIKKEELSFFSENFEVLLALEENAKKVNDDDEEIHIKEYNLKELTKLLSYYGIPKNKMVKYEMQQIITLFETEPSNTFIVEERRRLWQNIKELQHHPFFSKYILFDI
jgi:hypothetical protein